MVSINELKPKTIKNKFLMILIGVGFVAMPRDRLEINRGRQSTQLRTPQTTRPSSHNSNSD